MCIGALGGRLGLRRAAPRASATWPFGLVGLRATSHNRRTLWDIALRASAVQYDVMCHEFGVSAAR
jgi:hypothetical protein